MDNNKARNLLKLKFNVFIDKLTHGTIYRDGTIL